MTSLENMEKQLDRLNEMAELVELIVPMFPTRAGIKDQRDNVWACDAAKILAVLNDCRETLDEKIEQEREYLEQDAEIESRHERYLSSPSATGRI